MGLKVFLLISMKDVRIIILGKQMQKYLLKKKNPNLGVLIFDDGYEMELAGDYDMYLNGSKTNFLEKEVTVRSCKKLPNGTYEVITADA